MTNALFIDSDLEYHFHRARVERALAHQCADGPTFDAHMELAELHLQRALLLETVQGRAVGNVTPLRPSPEHAHGQAFVQLETCADQG